MEYILCKGLSISYVAQGVAFRFIMWFLNIYPGITLGFVQKVTLHLYMGYYCYILGVTLYIEQRVSFTLIMGRFGPILSFNCESFRRCF